MFRQAWKNRLGKIATGTSSARLRTCPSRVPEFEEVRDAVLAAWKEKEAAQLALKNAQELAKSAQESGDSVADVAKAGNYEVVTTDLFSWLSYGTTQAELQRGPRLGEAPPLEAVGGDFMTKVFDLKTRRSNRAAQLR